MLHWRVITYVDQPRGTAGYPTFIEYDAQSTIYLHTCDMTVFIADIGYIGDGRENKRRL